MTQLSSKTLFQTDLWNIYTQIKFMSIQKSERKDVQGQRSGLLEL